MNMTRLGGVARRNAARVLDIDLLAYGDKRLSVEGLIVPHPRLHQRGFVLYPLQQIAADWQHPVLKLSVGQMLSQLPEDQIVDDIASSQRVA